MAPANKKMAPANKEKTGPKLNSKNNNAKTRLDWFKVCDDYKNNSFTIMGWLSEENDDIVWQMKRIYNADQTGLFYQKLPNRIYVDKDLKKDCAGAKQMPLSLVGKAKNPRCFDHLDNPPMAYKDQKNAWFDQKITIWWIFQVFIPHHTHHYGRSKAILLLDNCTAHKINMEFLPDWLKIVFLPPNVTNTHQPADMGIIASLKVGYKTSMLMQLLEIFDKEDGYEKAARLRQSTKKGCRGLRLGGKPTVLDAMHILDEMRREKDQKSKELCTPLGLHRKEIQMICALFKQ